MLVSGACACLTIGSIGEESPEVGEGCSGSFGHWVRDIGDLRALGQ